MHSLLRIVIISCCFFSVLAMAHGRGGNCDNNEAMNKYNGSSAAQSCSNPYFQMSGASRDCLELCATCQKSQGGTNITCIEANNNTLCVPEFKDITNNDGNMQIITR